MDRVGLIACLSNFSFLLLTSIHSHVKTQLETSCWQVLDDMYLHSLFSVFMTSLKQNGTTHVDCYKGIYTYIQYFAVLSTLLQPVGEANKGEMFTRRENMFCSIGYYIDMDKNKIQVCATFIVGNVAIDIFTFEGMIYIFILHLFKVDKSRIEQWTICKFCIYLYSVA